MTEGILIKGSVHQCDVDGVAQALLKKRRISEPDPVLDSQHADAYGSDRFTHLLEREQLKAFQLAPAVIRKAQSSYFFTFYWRSVWIDYMLQCKQKMNIKLHTFYLAVRLFDRSLVKIRLEDELDGETLALCCLRFAEKFNENNSKSTVEASLNTAKPDIPPSRITAMEKEVFKAMAFDINSPTTESFLPRLLETANEGSSSNVACLATYLLQLAVLSEESIAFLPSKMASAAVSVSLHSCGKASWSIKLSNITQYQTLDFSTEAIFLTSLHDKAPSSKLLTAFNYFSSTEFYSVAQCLVSWKP